MTGGGGGVIVGTGSIDVDVGTGSTSSRRSSLALDQQEECVDLLLDDHQVISSNDNPQDSNTNTTTTTTTTTHHRDSSVTSVAGVGGRGGGGGGGGLLRPGQLERLESRRGLRESQSRIIIQRRKSFIIEFSEMNGPPQIALLMALLAIGYGSTMGITPAIMSDRFARINHNYIGPSCDSFTSSTNDIKPNECFLGNNDAQSAASISNLISNTLTFCTASLMGSLSDEYGRKGMCSTVVLYWMHCLLNTIYDLRFTICYV
jgi:hypothetical protein